MQLTLCMATKPLVKNEIKNIFTLKRNKERGKKELIESIPEETNARRASKISHNVLN